MGELDSVAVLLETREPSIAMVSKLSSTEAVAAAKDGEQENDVPIAIARVCKRKYLLKNNFFTFNLETEKPQICGDKFTVKLNVFPSFY